MHAEGSPIVIVIVGPTASGKSAVGMELARRTGGEIVSADSMQVYLGMDIGTAKATPQERAAVPHHLIDVARPDEIFSVARYQELAAEAVSDIWDRGRLPIVVGGTGLYIDALIYGFLFPEEGRNPEVRAGLEKEAAECGVGALYARLEQVDPAAAARIHHNDLRRIVRALEVHMATGEPISSLQGRHQGEPRYETRIFGIAAERDVLVGRINARVDRMVEQGLLEEVKALFAAGYGPELTSMQAIGYKEFGDYIRGRASLDQALEALKAGTRRYAKRQMTWFKRNPDVEWVYAGDHDGPAGIADHIMKASAVWLDEAGYAVDVDESR